MTQEPTYRAFWDNVGTNFPSLKGARSTAYYFACERTLLESYFPADLRGLRVFKTDLWDEAKNTEILRWAADRGARPFGVDIAYDVVEEARKVLHRHDPGFTGGDVRAIPYADESFDLIYSMGTIEHFPEFPAAMREMYRVLKPGGTAIVGVPNKLDPFLRPAMVHAMNTFKLYDYGVEKSFYPWELRRLAESAGFHVSAISGILFIPGWLRMADLAVHTRFPVAAKLSGLLVRPFEWAYRYVPALRRHGYLIACVAHKPAA
jgi:SAM-dependent methyltransferase